MIDTGTTMKATLAKIRELYQPKSLEVALAFHKMTPKNLSFGYFAKYTGFLVGEVFYVGYGCDYNRYFTDFNHFGELNELGISTFAKSGSGDK